MTFAGYIQNAIDLLDEECQFLGIRENPLCALLAVPDEDLAPNSAQYLESAGQCSAAWERIFSRCGDADAAFLILNALQALRTAGFPEALCEVQQDLATRLISSSELVHGEVNAAYSVLQEVHQQLIDGCNDEDTIAEQSAMLAQMKLKEWEETQNPIDQLLVHVYLAIISEIMCITKDWKNEEHRNIYHRFAQIWYDTFYLPPESSPRNGYLFEPLTLDEEDDDDDPMSLNGSVILLRQGNVLSDDAINTIRHFRYYCADDPALVLFSDSVVALLTPDSIQNILEQAEEEAGTAMSCMPDFDPMTMDDGGGLLQMTNASICAYRPYGLHPSTCGSLMPALEARQECLESCERDRIIALVYFDGEGFHSANDA